MPLSDVYRKQHREILRLAEDLLRSAQSTALPQDPHAAYRNLLGLAAKLKMHLTLEDENLYPRLMAHEDAQVSRTATQYMEEMGGIRGAFEAYLATWNSPEAIRADGPGFEQATRGILAALGRRIVKEDGVLYTLLDRLG